MQTEWIVIDGNNLLHAAPPELVGDIDRNFVAARLRLARRMEELAGLIARRITIVFDGTQAGRDERFDGSAVDILFCGRHDTADAAIERLVAGRPQAAKMLVVTSDRAERDTVEAKGVPTMSCTFFLQWIAQAGADLQRSLSTRRSTVRRNTLGDAFDRRPNDR